MRTETELTTANVLDESSASNRAGVRKRRPAHRRSRIVPLEQALVFEGEHIIEDFHAKYRVSRDEARALFEDVKKWVWACAVAHERGGIAMLIDGRLLILDYMWHTFVLFTREYHAYCEAIGARYIHHAPTTRGEQRDTRREAARDPEAFRRKELAQRQRLYGFLYDCLGEETVRRWFLELPARYSTKAKARIEVALRGAKR